MTGNGSWLTELALNRQDVDWRVQGDALIQYLRDEMPVFLTQSNWIPENLKANSDHFTSYGHVLYSEELSSRLILGSFADGIHVLVETTLQPSGEEELEPWKSAYDRAYRRLFEAEPEFSWWAAIGPHDGAGYVPKVTDGVTIKNIKVEPAGEPYTEGLDGRTNPHLAGASFYSSYPLVAHGKTSGFNWESAATRTTRDLNAVCALFSLEFDSYWSIRNPIVPYDAENLDIATIKLHKFAFGLSEENVRGAVLGNTRAVTVPSWIATAYGKLERNEILYSAVHSHQQGLAVEAEHPSLALICFVSAIEGIGASLEELSHCEHCGSHTGAQRRFRKALRTALSAKEAKELQAVYTLRSETAHSGVLHGNETAMGNIFTPFTSFAGEPPGFSFRYRQLWKLKDASKRVLIKHLSI
ncbi:MAG TPA: hypothetical protein VJ870_17930 [Amycolatopsis sp.]|nr:hypothetical protein [Amycolatopsis sp.]